MKPDQACIVGIGSSEFGKRGTLASRGSLRLALDATQAAVADAGLDMRQIDGFSSFSDDESLPYNLMLSLPIETLRYAGMTWGGIGSGLPTAVLNAAMAVASGSASYVVVLRTLVQDRHRMGSSVMKDLVPGHLPRHRAHTLPFGFSLPPVLYALRARRHMDTYGTTSEQLAAVAINARRHSFNNPAAIFRDPLTIEQHQSSRLIVDPLRLYDCCLESDGAAAFVVTTPERASDLRHRSVFIHGISTVTDPGWTTPMTFAGDERSLASAAASLSRSRALQGHWSWSIRR